METVTIEYIIDDTSKEIYTFKKVGGVWYYTGIYYSYRNDNSDIWGDQWNDHHNLKRLNELTTLASSLGYDDCDDFLDYSSYEDREKMDEIYLKYNPCRQKTKLGKTYFSGHSWGVGRSDGNPVPKFTEEEIIREITNQVSKVKIKL